MRSSLGRGAGPGLRDLRSRLQPRRALVAALFVVLAGLVLSDLAGPDPLQRLIARVAEPPETGLVAAPVSAAPPTAGPAPAAPAEAGTRVGLADEVPERILERIPVGKEGFLHATAHLALEPDPGAGAPWRPARMVEWVDVSETAPGLAGPLRVEYTMDVELTRRIFHILRVARVPRGHVIVMLPDSGRVLAYASTDPGRFPAGSAYPAASLVKIVTAAAALDSAPDEARRVCRYRGSPYRLTRSRLYPPKRGNEMSLERALATSNNQCFAQLAVNTVGERSLLSAIERFGWLEEPAPGHVAGSASAGEDDYDLGRLGCGLAGCRITPLHAVQLAGALAEGKLVTPWWVERVVDVHGRALPLPPRRGPRRVMRPALADELRSMLVRTTTRGTARSAFRDRRGRPRLGEVRVAGKTGNLSGDRPSGRYEWFVAAAPADAPEVAIAVLQLQSDLWWARSSEVGADVLAEIFCAKGECRADLAARYTGGLQQARAGGAGSGMGTDAGE